MNDLVQQIQDGLNERANRLRETQEDFLAQPSSDSLEKLTLMLADYQKFCWKLQGLASL